MMQYQNDTSRGNSCPADDTTAGSIYKNVITIHSTPKVVRNFTFESTTSAEETDGEPNARPVTHKAENDDSLDHVINGDDNDDDDDDDIVDGCGAPRRGNDHRTSSRVETLDCSLFASWEDVVGHVFYISTFAIIGTISRIYIGRFFGLDCIRNERENESPNDFFTPLSSQICVTSDGKTQRGGALFIDLPANMLGSFLYGVISNENHPFGWIRPDHPLQQDIALHVGLRVGLCGCLTTFSSWNTQMVEMMDGSDTIYGPQVGTAIFGYIIGLICAICSCICGTHLFHWLRQFHPLLSQSVVVPEGSVLTSQRDKNVIITSPFFNIRGFALVLVCAGLLGSFIFADTFYGSVMYRELWLGSLMAPFGALLRWRLKTLNGRPARGEGIQWFPWGTFSANVVASIICIVGTALKIYIVEPNEVSTEWLLPVLVAVTSGFAGSLSTTSSLVHEVLVLETLFQSYSYTLTTIICSMLVSLLIYIPIARVG